MYLEFLMKLSLGPQKSLRFLVIIGQHQNWCGDALFFLSFLFGNNFLPTGKYLIHVRIHLSRISPYKVYWLREVHKKSSYPYVKKLFKTQHGRIPIDPAILAAIGHRFIHVATKI